MMKDDLGVVWNEEVEAYSRNREKKTWNIRQNDKISWPRFESDTAPKTILERYLYANKFGSSRCP